METTAPFLQKNHYNRRQSEIPENKEDLQLIWLDKQMKESNDCLHTQSMLIEMNPAAQFYTDIVLCMEFIKSIVDENILFIVSGAFIGEVLSYIIKHRPISAIFILCSNYEEHITLLNHSDKIVHIFTDKSTLIHSIDETMRRIKKQTFVFKLYDQKQKSTKDLSRESALFLWNQVLIEVLKNMPQDDRSKDDMLNMCLDYYQTNKREQEKIELFRSTYSHDKAIEWYTNECFLYKLLNKALRTEDIELLYLFRYYIIDLCADLKRSSLILRDKGTLFLYRGQRMSTVEFDKIQQSVGLLISTNGFFSTSRDINVSLAFAGHGSPCPDDIRIVLFEIQVDSSLKSLVFADIDDRSHMRGEREVLFDLNATFKINGVVYDSALNLWKTQLTATDEGSEHIHQYLNLANEDMSHFAPIVYFGRLLLYRLGNVKQAEKYFNVLLRTLPSDDPDIDDVYSHIGAVHRKKGNLDLALKNILRAYEIRQQRPFADNLRIYRSFYNLGMIYLETGDFNQALDHFQRTLAILESLYPDIDHLHKAMTIEYIGVIYREMKEFDLALEYLTRALEIFGRVLPEKHPSIARCLGNIGLVHEIKDDLDVALNFFHRQVKMEEQLLPIDHPDHMAHFDWIVRTYKKKNDVQTALIFCHEQLDKQRNQLDSSHPHINHTLMAMKSLDSEIDFRRVLEIHQDASSIVDQCPLANKERTVTCIDVMMRRSNSIQDKVIHALPHAVEMLRSTRNPMPFDSNNPSAIRSHKSADDVRKHNEPSNHLRYRTPSWSVADIPERHCAMNKPSKANSKAIIHKADSVERFESAAADHYDNSCA